MSKHNDLEGPPCAHMEALLHRAADGSSRGLRKWYAVSHASRCGRCGRFLQRLEAMIGKLHRAKQVEAVPEDAVARLRQGKWRTETPKDAE